MTPARSAIRRFAHTPAASPAADRILIIRLGALGDVVRTLPAVEAIRDHYAEAQVAWLVEPRAAAVLHGQKAIDEILALVSGAGFEASQVFAIRLALEEAMENAFRHGNRNDPRKAVTVVYEASSYGENLYSSFVSSVSKYSIAIA